MTPAPASRHPATRSASARRVVVSGLGIVSAAGIGAAPTWARLREAPPTPSVFRAAEPTAGVCFHAYQTPPYNLSAIGVPGGTLAWMQTPERRCAHDLRHLVGATALALLDAGLPLRCDDAEPGVAIFAANESPGFEELSQALFSLGGVGLATAPRALYDALAPRFFELNTFLPPYYLARAFGLTGQALFVNSACASGLNAIDAAAQAVLAGRADIAVAAAADDPLSVAKYFWFESLGLYAADGVLRPFDAEQTGTVFGDGGAAVILEEREHARARGAAAYAEYAGAGFAQDGWKITVPAAAKSSGEIAVRAALREAEIEPEEVDLVVPHGVGTSASDAYEARTLHRVFGGGAWPAVTALKPLVGHALGASALIESVLLLAAMKHGCIPPTCGHRVPLPRHALPLVDAWRERPIRVAVKLTSAFAGYYGAIVFRSAEAGPG